MKVIIALLSFVIPSFAFSQADTSLVKFHNPAAVAAPKGYSHAASIDLGTCTMLIVSGQVALDQQGNLVGKNDLSKQTEQVFKNIKAIAEDAGATMNDVVKLSYYLLDASQVQAVRDIRNKFINIQQPPASTLVQVSKLFREDILIEIEATIIVAKKL